MRISKMYLKQSFSCSKWVLQAIFFLTLLSNCGSGSLNYDTPLLPDCIKFLVFFLCYWIVNLMRISKVFFRKSFSFSK